MDLAKQVLTPLHQVNKVNFYTARVSGKLDPQAPARQQAYFRALESVPDIQIHLGSFLFSEKWSYLIKPPQTKPSGYTWNTPLPELVWTAKTEEKGSDVNLASHLVRDAFTNQFDSALVLTNDTDLVEPIRIAIQEAGKTVGILCPIAPNAPINPRTGRRPTASKTLKDVASFCIYIHNSHLNASLFPNPITLPNGSTLDKPVGW